MIELQAPSWQGAKSNSEIHTSISIHQAHFGFGVRLTVEFRVNQIFGLKPLAVKILHDQVDRHYAHAIGELNGIGVRFPGQSGLVIWDLRHPANHHQ